MSLKATLEGLSMAPIQTVNETPLLSRATLLAAIVSCAGFRWFPIPQPGQPDDAAAFSDVTEITSADGKTITPRRTVTWLFVADDSREIDGRPYSPGDLMAAVRDPDVAARADAHPALFLPAVARAYQAGEDSMLPSERRRAILETAPATPLEVRDAIEHILTAHRGFCIKLQSKQRDPEFGAPLSRTLRVRLDEERSIYLPYDLTPEARAAEIARLSALK